MSVCDRSIKAEVLVIKGRGISLLGKITATELGVLKVGIWHSQQKVLPFLFKDFLLFSGRVESRDNMCITENHLINRNHTCMYLAKSHIFTAKVLRDKPPPSLFD